jgi:hypothetical protein
MPQDVAARCSAIEECYEFLLAYAAQGLTTDAGTQAGSQIREFLHKAVAAMAGLAEAYAEAVTREALEPAGPYRAFLAVVARDARDSQAAIELVLAQPAISSQLIDNLNASIHLRALLTDLFLIDEVFKMHSQARMVRG